MCKNQDFWDTRDLTEWGLCDYHKAVRDLGLSARNLASRKSLSKLRPRRNSRLAFSSSGESGLLASSIITLKIDGIG
jgi:hypothetical protein